MRQSIHPIRFIVYLFIIWIAFSLFACTAPKNGCGSYDAWEQKTKFRSH